MDGHYQLNKIMSGRKDQLKVIHGDTCVMLLPVVHLTSSVALIFFPYAMSHQRVVTNTL